MIEYSALAIVVLVALYFIALGTSSLITPSFAKRFLLGFAESAFVHYTELLVRLVVGVAFLIHSPRMHFANGFHIFGWLLIVTTAALLLVPWQWHRRFASKSVPQALRYLTIIGLCSLAFGGFIIVAVARGTSA
jgi:uncharacterized protein YjeT (DUF2065 family)